MFCPNCGTQTPENANCCPSCGTALKKSAPSEPVATPNPAPAAAPVTPGVKMGKQEYLFKTPSSRMLVILSWVLGIICALVMVLGANKAVNGFFGDIPIVKMVVGEENVERTKEQLSEAAEFVDEYIEEGIEKLDDLDREQVEEFEEEAGISIDKLDVSVKKLRKIVESPSIGGMSKITSAFTDNSEEFGAFTLLKNIIFVFAAVVVLITLLATFFGRTVLLILFYILSIPFYIFLAGTGYLVFASIGYIALAVILSRLNSNYRAYKRNN